MTNTTPTAAEIAAGAIAAAKLATDERLIEIMDEAPDSPAAAIAAHEYGQRQVKVQMKNAAARIVDAIAEADLVSAAWATAHLAAMLEDEHNLAAYGKRIENVDGDPWRRRIVDAA